MGRKGTEDAFEILNGRVIRPGHGPKASIAALQWAADRAGQSYGVFTQRLSVEDETRIQSEYEQFQREQLAELTQRCGKPTKAEDVTTNEFIITDDDM